MRCLGAIVSVVVGIMGIYQLMIWDAHFLLLGAFGSACGLGTGSILARRRGLVPGAALGFLAPLIYLPFWLAFDLPPSVDLDF